MPARDKPPRDLPMLEVVRMQQAACERAGSHLYSVLLDAVAGQVEHGGVCAELLAPWAENALADAIPLRMLGAVHRIVLRGGAPDLARLYPSAGGTDRGDPVPAFLATVEAHRDALAEGMRRGVQTNEVGRACSLVGGFHEVARRTRLPLRTLEVGASAGLLLHWDRYRYVGGGTEWGPEGTLEFIDPWDGAAPPFADQLEVGDRAGCDINPIDPSTDDGVVTLRGFLWPDQVHRRHRLDAAIAVAQRFSTTVERADAGDWVASRLAEPAVGLATVVYHSIVLQYLPRDTFTRMRRLILDAGRAATHDAPLFWLRMEPAGEFADVRLRSWPGGDDRHLATTDYHGPPVSWAPER